jgi:hypothetical protein
MIALAQPKKRSSVSEVITILHPFLDFHKQYQQHQQYIGDPESKRMATIYLPSLNIAPFLLESAPLIPQRNLLCKDGH